MSLRTRLIRILQALGSEALVETAEEEPEEDTPEEVQVSAIIMGPNGPVRVPDGMHPMQVIHDMMRQGTGQMPPAPQNRPESSPTMQGGPPGDLFDLKTVVCAELVDPIKDPEVQKLLREGWEPYAAHKFSGNQGFPGVRMYFRKTLHN